MKDDEQVQLREMLRGLDKVAAPPNFDAGLRARLDAMGDERSARGRAFGFGFAVPAMAVLIVLLGGAWLATRWLKTDDASVATLETPSVATTKEIAFPSSAPASSPAKSDNTETVATVSTPPMPANSRIAVPVSTPRRDIPDVRENNGGSRDLSARSEKPKLPEGFESSPAPTAGDVATANYSVRDAFELIGIGADFAGGKWTVKSVTPGRVAAHSGIRTNDVIVAIDDIAVTGETITTRTFSGQSVTVLRSGESLTIRLKLQP